MNEVLLVTRLREGITQDDAAATFGVPEKRYRAWERGDERVPRGTDPLRLGPPPGTLAPRELCMVQRRRKGMTQAELAKKLGCSRWWVNQMENGNAPARALVEFWRKRRA